MIGTSRWLRDAAGLTAAMGFTAMVGLPASGATVPNGGFDDPATYLDGWLNVGADAIWSSDDADGAFDSGSMELTNSYASGTEIYPYECLSVTGGQTYRYGTKFEILANQTAVGEASVRLLWASDPECLTTIGYAPTVASTAIGAWTALQGEDVAPLDATTGHLIVLLLKTSGAASDLLKARFDDVFLPEPARELSTCVAVGALALVGATRAFRPPGGNGSAPMNLEDES